MVDPAAARLKLARKARGFRTAKQFAEENGIPQPTYAMHEKGSRGLTRETAIEYATLLSVSLDWLLTGEGEGPEPADTQPTAPVTLTPIRIVGTVEAGQWLPALESGGGGEEILVSEDLRDHQAFGLKVHGPSMNMRYPDGSTVVCVPLLNFWRELESGDDVICQRHEHDLIESTIKELRFTEAEAWLWPRSDHPEHQAPIRLPWPALEDNEMRQNEVVILAVVVAAYTIKIRR